MPVQQPLAAARQGFLAALKRDTAPTECPRFLAVLDALIAWSLERPTLVKFNAEESHDGTVTFSRVGSKNVVMWTASPRRREMPRLELLPRAARFLPDADRAAVVETFNAHARDAIEMGEPLRINFGALKNETARVAVLECLDRLLVVT